jgi:hypothetical protein
MDTWWWDNKGNNESEARMRAAADHDECAGHKTLFWLCRYSRIFFYYGLQVILYFTQPSATKLLMIRSLLIVNRRLRIHLSLCIIAYWGTHTRGSSAALPTLIILRNCPDCDSISCQQLGFGPKPTHYVETELTDTTLFKMIYTQCLR